MVILQLLHRLMVKQLQLVQITASELLEMLQIANQLHHKLSNWTFLLKLPLSCSSKLKIVMELVFHGTVAQALSGNFNMLLQTTNSVHNSGKMFKCRWTLKIHTDLLVFLDLATRTLSASLALKQITVAQMHQILLLVLSKLRLLLHSLLLLHVHRFHSVILLVPEPLLFNIRTMWMDGALLMIGPQEALTLAILLLWALWMVLLLFRIELTLSSLSALAELADLLNHFLSPSRL